LFQHLTNEQIEKDSNNIINVTFAKPQILKQVQDDKTTNPAINSNDNKTITLLLSVGEAGTK